MVSKSSSYHGTNKIFGLVANACGDRNKAPAAAAAAGKKQKKKWSKGKGMPSTTQPHIITACPPPR